MIFDASRRRLLTVLVLGFASGLPFSLVGTTLQAWFTVSGADIFVIGWLGFIGQPYVYKFLWAPFFDRYFPPILTRRRGWIVVFQLILVGCLVAMALLQPIIHPYVLVGVAFLAALSSASQDIVFDAYKTELLPEKERGLGASFSVLGYRFGVLLSGGLALILAAFLGWRVAYLLMAACLLPIVWMTWVSPEPDPVERSPQSFREAFEQPLNVFLKRKRALLLLLFIVLYKLGDAFTGSTGHLVTVFLLRYLDFSLLEVGSANKIVGLIASMIGVLVGGMLLTRIGLYQALMSFGLLQAGSNVLFWLLALVGKHYGLMLSVIFIDNVCAGMGTTALVALLMSLCDARYTAAQYALLSAFAAISGVFFGPVGAMLVSHIGWVSFFFWTIIIAMPALFLLWLLRQDIKQLVVLKR